MNSSKILVAALPKVLNLNRSNLKVNQFICNWQVGRQAVLPMHGVQTRTVKILGFGPRFDMLIWFTTNTYGPQNMIPSLRNVNDDGKMELSSSDSILEVAEACTLNNYKGTMDNLTLMSRNVKVMFDDVVLYHAKVLTLLAVVPPCSTQRFALLYVLDLGDLSC